VAYRFFLRFKTKLSTLKSVPSNDERNLREQRAIGGAPNTQTRGWPAFF
jgi:hypothetical protein